MNAFINVINYRSYILPYIIHFPKARRSWFKISTRNLPIPHKPLVNIFIVSKFMFAHLRQIFRFTIPNVTKCFLRVRIWNMEFINPNIYSKVASITF